MHNNKRKIKQPPFMNKVYEIIILKMSLSEKKGLLLLFSKTQIFGEDCLWTLKLRLFFPTDQKVVANLMNTASVSANMEKVTLLYFDSLAAFNGN